MALTDHCDVFLSALEAGLNRVLRHVRRQWPSMFNYGTLAISQNRQLLCKQIDFDPVVPARNNPIITVLDPVPVIGTLYGLDYCAQITDAVIDLSPGNVLTLPPQLGVLPAQRLAAKATVCGALACPPNDVVDHLPVKLVPPDPPPAQNKRDYATKTEAGHVAAQPTVGRDDKRDPEIEVIPTRSLRCFCLDGYIVAGAQFVPDAAPPHKQRIMGRLNGIEVVDLTPDELESMVECYATLVVKLFVFPQLALKPIEFVEDDLMGTKVTIAPSPTSPSIPNNPAIEDDLLKAFLKLDLTKPPPPAPGGGGPPGPSAPPPPPLAPGVDVARTRSGPFDLTIALSAGAATVLFNGIRDAFKFSKSDSANFGPFTMGYAIGLHLAGGTIELRNDGTIRIKELDIKWDTAKVWLGIDIPEICVGGFCIIPNPFTGGCAVSAPKICVFSASPDIGPNIDISGLITSEISATVRPHVQYSRNHPSSTDAWTAQAMKIQNRWILIADIIRIDFDLFDIADIVGDLLRNALENAVNNLLGGLPGWAKSLILAIMGPIIDFITDIIDLPDDIGEWLEDKLGVTFGLFDLILTAVADHLAKGEPLIKLEDPFPVESPTGLIDLMIPIEFLDVRVNEHELIVEGDIGG